MHTAIPPRTCTQAHMHTHTQNKDTATHIHRHDGQTDGHTEKRERETGFQQGRQAGRQTLVTVSSLQKVTCNAQQLLDTCPVPASHPLSLCSHVRSRLCHPERPGCQHFSDLFRLPWGTCGSTRVWPSQPLFAYKVALEERTTLRKAYDSIYCICINK